MTDYDALYELELIEDFEYLVEQLQEFVENKFHHLDARTIEAVLEFVRSTYERKATKAKPRRCSFHYV